MPTSKANATPQASKEIETEAGRIAEMAVDVKHQALEVEGFVGRRVDAIAG